MYVNPEECIECDACREACPVSAIYREEEVPTQWHGYLAQEYAAFGLRRGSK
jgi:ferredoxin